MLEEITLDKVASYKQKIKITNLRKLNVFYGLNGTGKSTISRYLNQINNPSDDFKRCDHSISSDNNVEFIVYNYDFVKNNFQESKQQQGIFTLDTSNTSALNEITNAEKRIQELRNKAKPYEAQEKQKINTRDETRDKLCNRLWEARQKILKSNLHICLEGSNSATKAKNLEKTLSTPLTVDDLTHLEKHSLEALEAEVTELNQASGDLKEPYQAINVTLDEYSNTPLLKENIINSDNSYLQEIISELKNHDWIVHGVKNYIDKSNDCPFCARPMNEKLKQNISAIINETYKSKTNELEETHKKYLYYSDQVKSIIERYKKDTQLSGNHIFITHTQKLEYTIEFNKDVLLKKITEPSKEFSTKSTDVFIKEINEIINTENQKINEFNEKVKNKNKTLNHHKNLFWKLFKLKHLNEILEFETVIQNTDTELKEIKEIVTPINQEIETLSNSIAEQKRKTKNLENSISNINSNLKNLGMDGFYIKKIKSIGEIKSLAELSSLEDLPLYEIVRKDEDSQEKVFETLSEGEKTLISFLYFIELCKGQEINERSIPTDQRIIVIDDPISSLSFNLVYDISILIKEIFFKNKTPFMQILILTHHLYFLQELLGRDNDLNDCQIYKVYKTDFSNVKTIKREEIQNHHDSYWQIVRNAQESGSFNPVLPNAMRNILEYYFRFISAKKSYHSALQKLSKEQKDPSYKSLLRFLNGGSHLGAFNIIDIDEIDVSRYIECFREIFVHTNHEQYYQSMMKE